MQQIYEQIYEHKRHAFAGRADSDHGGNRVAGRHARPARAAGQAAADSPGRRIPFAIWRQAGIFGGRPPLFPLIQSRQKGFIMKFVVHRRSPWLSCRRLMLGGLLLALLALNIPLALAGTITLKDGTVLEGEIKKLGSSYTVRTTDGQFKMVAEDQIESVEGVEGAPAADGTSGDPAAGPSFEEVLRKSERLETAVRGSALWQTWIDKNESHPKLSEAEEQLKLWKERVDQKAERINGDWIGGDDLKDLQEKVRELTDRAAYALNDNQATLDVMKDLTEARRLYPKYIPTNFYLGYWNALKGPSKYNEAARYFETVLRQAPNMSEALNNIAIIYSVKGQHEKAILTFHKAVQLDENPVIVGNLMSAFNNAPRAMYQANPRIRPIYEDVMLLARKNGNQGSDRFILVHLKPSDERSPEEEETYGSGIVGYGTGFFVSANGLIMTNEHVATPGDTLIVRLSDGTEKEAERIIIDDEQDIALIKIEVDEDVPFVPLADYDQPKFGADVTILGFPLGEALGRNVKITRGVVTGIESAYDKVDIFTDATVNPGNSGGPMVDKYGHLLALVAMKTYASQDTTSYGMGLSNGRLRTFFEKHADLLSGKEIDGVGIAKGSGPGDQEYNTEQLAELLRPATVQIIMVND